MSVKYRVHIAVVFLVALLHLKSAFAQTNFLSGYIVTSKADTIRGLVDYRNWETNPNRIIFKQQKAAESVSYLPMDILAFGVLDETYVSAIVQAETSARRMDQLDDDASPHFKTDTTFLQTIFAGEKSLYHYKSPDGKENFYIRSSNGNYEYLVYKMYLVNVDNKQYSKENKQYINQLVLYFNDCPAMQQKVYAGKYTVNSLRNLFKSYYSCTNKETVFVKTQDKVKLDIGAMAGPTFNKLKFKTASSEYLENTAFKSPVSVSAGLYFDIVFPRNQGKWSIYNELMYSAYTATGTYTKVEHQDSYRVYDSELSYAYCKVNNMLRYKYPAGGLFLFANVGISNGFALKATNEKTITNVFYQTKTTTTENAVASARKHEQSLLLGLGARYHKFSFEARYELGNGMSDITSIKSTTTRFHFLLGFQIF